jgi:hypothetical protein
MRKGEPVCVPITPNLLGVLPRFNLSALTPWAAPRFQIPDQQRVVCMAAAAGCPGTESETIRDCGKAQGAFPKATIRLPGSALMSFREWTLR